MGAGVEDVAPLPAHPFTHWISRRLFMSTSRTYISLEFVLFNALIAAIHSVEEIVEVVTFIFKTS